jgi:hypothetical protein
MAIAGAIILVNVLTLWCIDVSVSALMFEKMAETANALGQSAGTDGKLVGFYEANPTLTYHLGLCLNILMNFSMFLIIVFLVSKRGK